MTSFVETFEAPHLGMDTESAPHRLAKGYARDVLNLLTGTPGRIRPRGGVTTGGLTIPTNYIWANGSGRLLFGIQGSTALKYVNNSLGAGTSVAVTAASVDAIPGDANTAVGDVVYGKGASTAAKLIRWDGSNATPVAYTNGPTGFLAMTYWLNRLWTLGGKLVGSATVQNDRVGWSDLLDSAAALPDAAASWQDDVSGLTNQIVFPSVGQGGNAPVGFGRLTNAMVVFGSRGGDILIGSSPSSVTVRAHAVTHGCVDKRAIVEYNGMLIWLAPEGLFLFDGVQEVELSTSVRTILRRACDPRLASAGGSYFLTLLPNDYLLVTVNPTFGVSSQYLVHLPTRSWSRINCGFGFPVKCVSVQATYDGSVTRAILSDWNGLLWTLDPLVQPEFWALAGVDSNLTGSGHVPFVASYDSRLAVLGTPSQKGKVTRVDATSLASRSTATAPDADEGWFVTASDTDNSAVLAKQQLTSVVAGSTTYGDTKHDTFEPNAEANEVYVHVDMGGSDTATFAALELQDIYIEYVLAQKPASF